VRFCVGLRLFRQLAFLVPRGGQMRNSRRAEELLARVRPLPGAAHVAQLYAQVADRQHVVGCYVGCKTKGRKRTRRASLVCLVKKKVKPARLRGPGQLIPKRIAWTDINGNSHEFPTDVVECNGRVKPQAFAGPGDDVLTTLGEFASVGFALLHPTLGTVITTAGHAFTKSAGIVEFVPANAPLARLSAFREGPATCDAQVLKIHLTDKGDYALLRPLQSVPCANLFRDESPISRPYIPGTGDLNRELIVLSAAGPRSTFFRGVFGQLLHQPSGVAMRNLLLTDRATVPGDSGACLVDVFNQELRVWGLLVGNATVNGAPMSVYTTALAPLVLENADYLS
jgi:hypothetical protein